MMLGKCQLGNALAEHYERLLNVEYEWDPDHLSKELPLEGPHIPITIDMVKKAISKMKLGKVVEMIKQLQKKYLAVNTQRLYMAFVVLEKAF